MKIVGNGSKATILIFIFIAVLCGLSYRCQAAQHIDLKTGISFGPVQSGPVLGLDISFPQSDNVEIFAGTLLWGQTKEVTTNWDWHFGFKTCRGRFCAGIGASYLQKIDAANGSHTNFALSFSYKFGGRVNSAEVFHLSNAGTTMPNRGRNAALINWRLQ